MEDAAEGKEEEGGGTRGGKREEVVREGRGDTEEEPEGNEENFIGKARPTT